MLGVNEKILLLLLTDHPLSRQALRDRFLALVGQTARPRKLRNDLLLESEALQSLMRRGLVRIAQTDPTHDGKTEGTIAITPVGVLAIAPRGSIYPAKSALPYFAVQAINEALRQTNTPTVFMVKRLLAERGVVVDSRSVGRFMARHGKRYHTRWGTYYFIKGPIRL